MSGKGGTRHDRILGLNAQKALEHGSVRFRRGDFRGAIRRYQEALQFEPGSALIQYNLGLALMEAHRFRDGLACFDAALAVYPEDYDALVGRSECLFGLKEFRRAISTLNRAIRLQPQRCMAHYNKGVALEEAGKYPAALKELTKAIRLARTRREKTDIYFYRGLCRYMLRRFRAAAADYAECARLNPEYPNVFWALGDCLLKLGDGNGARKAFEKHLRRNPKDKAEISSSLRSARRTLARSAASRR